MMVASLDPLVARLPVRVRRRRARSTSPAPTPTRTRRSRRPRRSSTRTRSGEVVTAAIDAGLRVDALHEHLDADRDERGDAHARRPTAAPGCGSAASCCRSATRCGPADEPAHRNRGLWRARPLPARRERVRRDLPLAHARGPAGGAARRSAGTGRPPRRPGTYRIAGLRRRTRSRCWRRSGRPTIVGHSLGGATAWTVAQQRPELVTKLFLEDPPLFGGEPESHAANSSIPSFVEQQAACARGRRAARRRRRSRPSWRSRGEADAGGDRGARLCAPAPRPRGPGPHHRRLVPGTDGHDVGGDGPGADPRRRVGSAFPEAHEARLAQTHPDVQVVRIPGAPHTIHDERAYRDEVAAQAHGSE